MRATHTTDRIRREFCHQADVQIDQLHMFTESVAVFSPCHRYRYLLGYPDEHRALVAQIETDRLAMATDQRHRNPVGAVLAELGLEYGP